MPLVGAPFRWRSRGRVSGGAFDGQSFTLGVHDPHDMQQVVRTAPRHRVMRGGSDAANQAGFLACSENDAPCGSIALRIQSPPGTSIGPLSIVPPFALTRSTAALMSGTRK